jgi:hypothetical protein
MAAADAAEQIRLRGFVHLDGEKFPQAAPPLAAAAMRRFATSWQDLAADTDLVDGGRYRLRRYGRLRVQLDGRSAHFSALEHVAFRQDVNPLYRGRTRMFEPIRTWVLHDPVMRHIVAFDVSVARMLLPLDDWEVGLHQIRIVATGADAGLPTPEGRHKDGHLFVGMHMLDRRSCVGGESIIEHADGGIERFTLTELLDSVIIDDAAVLHEVTPVYAAPGTDVGVRDMLLVDLNPHPSEVPAQSA